MASIASFEIPVNGSKFIVDVNNLFGNGDIIPFCFDTGANVSVIGLNTVCGDDPEQQNKLKSIILKQIQREKIQPYEAKSVALESMLLYPCSSRDVSVAGIRGGNFYFHIYLGNVGIALLGFDYINRCRFTHEIGKSIYVTAIEDMKYSLYQGKVLDFNEVIRQFTET